MNMHKSIFIIIRNYLNVYGNNLNIETLGTKLLVLVQRRYSVNFSVGPYTGNGPLQGEPIFSVF